MKTTIFSIITFLFLSMSTYAQIDRTKMPESGPAPKINLGTPKKFTLKNGLQVLVVENHKLPRVSVTLDIDNPPMAHGDKAGVEGFVGGLLGTGSTNISKEKYDKEVDYLGARISFGSESAFASSLSKYFPRVLELMADAAFNPIFSQEEFDKQMKQSIDGIKGDQKNVATIARKVDGLLTYGKNHPYGEFTTEKTLKNISLQDVKNLYAKTFKPNNAYLVVLGDVEFKKVKKQITKLFGSWKKGAMSSNTLPEVKNPSTTEINFIDMPNAVQSEIAIVHAINLKMNDKDYYAALLANQILGGGGTGRLYKNLREDKGYTYGAYSGIGASRYASRFKAAASVRNIVTDSAVVEFMKEINTLRYKKATKKELEIAKAKYLGRFVRAVERPSTVANYALDILQNDLPKNYYENYLKNINAVTLEDVQNAAIKYFKADKARIIITGKGMDVLKNLEKNSDYKINYFDKEGNPTSKPEMSKPLPSGVTKETVIDKYFEALGGKDKIKALKTTMVVYKASVNGRDIEQTEKRNDKNYGNFIAMGGNLIMKVIINKEETKMNGQAMPPNMSKGMSYNAGTFPEIGFVVDSNVKLTRIESIDGKEAFVLTKKGEVISVDSYYSIESGLKIKEVRTINFGGKTQTQEEVFSDYKDFNGVKFPNKKTGSLGPQKINYTIKEVKVNEGVSDADFK